jgi:TPR repeat protein
MYEHGLGVEQSYAEAITWYRQAGEQGEVAAEFTWAEYMRTDSASRKTMQRQRNGIARPQRSLIRAAPGASIVSSIFFMLMPEEVLVYGDCAANPNPKPHELAGIAIQSDPGNAQWR